MTIRDYGDYDPATYCWPSPQKGGTIGSEGTVKGAPRSFSYSTAIYMCDVTVACIYTINGN